jgi:C-terminal processing protease CtpA/Prc
MTIHLTLRPTLLVTLVSAFLFTSCEKEYNPDTVPVSKLPATNQEVNNWILTNMSYYYLWNDKIPAKTDTTLTPDKYFLSLLYDRNNTANKDRDRFSWIQASADELKASLGGQSKTTGMDYKLYYFDQARTTIAGSVIYVLPGSPAAAAGFKRGDIFTKVNGQALTTDTYSSLLAGDVLTFTMGTLVNGVPTDANQTRQVTKVVFQEDPILLDTVYTIGAKKIGYVVYNQFNPGVYKSSGPTDKTYDNKLDNIFGEFKQQGVNELVLDFRYNPGGYVSSSNNLASLVGKNIAGKVYYTQQWNPKVTADYDKKYNPGWNTQNFITKATNIGGNLNRVFILTTGSTASASELVINGLRPFMTVTTIGSTTVGKNVGSITISDANGRIKWGMQPLTFKSANSQGFTDYPTGFAPAVEVREPAYAMKAFGDLSEPLLGEAIYQISGTRTTARRGVITNENFIEAGSSLDQKAGGGNMFIDMTTKSVK